MTDFSKAAPVHPISRAEQIAHIKEHQQAFNDAYTVPGQNRTVESYFDEYDSREEPVYINVCSDLNIEPRGDWSAFYAPEGDDDDE